MNRKKNGPGVLLRQGEDFSYKAASLVAIASFGFALFFGLYLIKGTTYGPDGLSYHSTIAAQWLKGGSLTLTSLTPWAYYPCNTEILSLWHMLPFHSDAMVGLLGYFWLFFGLFLFIFLASVQRVSTFGILLWASVYLLTPTIQKYFKAFSPTDMVGALSLLAAFIFAWSPYKWNDRSLAFKCSCLAGLMAGLAVGCRITNASACVVLCVYIIYLARKYSQSWIKNVALFSASAFLLGGFWYVRNLLITGNPFYPAALGPFDGPLDAEYFERTKLITWIIQHPTDMQQWKYIIWEHINWPVSLFLVCAYGYLCGGYHLLTYKKTKDCHWCCLSRALFICGVLLLLLYPLTPFSGTSFDVSAPLNVNIRYMLLPYLIGLVLSLNGGFSKQAHRRYLWMTFLVLALLFRWFRPEKILFTVIVLSILVGLSFLIRRLKISGKREAVLVYIKKIVVPVFFAGLAICYSHQKNATDERLFQRYPVCRELESLPKGAKIVWFGGGKASYESFPFYGRNIQHHIARVGRDGAPMIMPHVSGPGVPNVYFENIINRKLKPSPPVPRVENVVGNLVNAEVDYVVIRKDEDYWPSQKKHIERSIIFKRIYESDDGLIFMNLANRSGDW
ncbi:MAG: hypothetical protein K9M57_05135 [Phycisphaerae bacterium]|nr:hypothetical protein [Phycisphaerae bacterium]